jgi:AcrR family transcriptional regulator
MRLPPSSVSPKDRLTTALATLIRTTGTPTAQKATVTQLCRLADVSRNSLYRYHRGILAAFRQHHHVGEACNAPAVQSERLLRRENADLRAQQVTLVALIDHFYLAHREVSSLLARRECELADVRRLLNAKPSLVRR